MKIYNFLYMNRKRAGIFLAVASLVVIILLVIFYKIIFEEQNLYYYVFSTIVQGFLALVAFLGALVVYKLQIIEAEFNIINEKIIPYLEHFLGANAKTVYYGESMDKMEEIIKKYEKGNVSKKEVRVLDKYLKRMKHLLENKGDIRSAMLDFSVISFINVGIALIFLPISELIVGKNLLFIGLCMIILNIVISCYSMFLATKIIRKIVGYSFYVKIQTGHFEVTTSPTKTSVE